jgi:hypothetical protein
MSNFLFNKLASRCEDILRRRLFRPAAEGLEKALNDTVPRCDTGTGRALTRILRSLRARCLLLDKGCLLRAVDLKGKDSRGVDREVLHVGEQEARSWFGSLLFPDGFSESELDSVRPWRLGRYVKDLKEKKDLVVVEVNRLLSRQIERDPCWHIPRWLRLTIPIPSSWDEMKLCLRKSTLTQIRAVKNRPFRFDVSREPQAFREFHDQLYVPFIAARHKESAIYYQDDQLFSYFQKGLLLRIWEENQWVSGALLRVKGRQARCFVMGVRNGDPALLTRHALKAVYYFMVHWAMEEKLTSLDMGRTRPLFEDGVFRQKRKWGGHVIPDPWEEACLHVLPGKALEWFHELPLRHPLVEQLESEFQARVRLESPLPPDGKKLDDLLDPYVTPGLSAIEIAGPDGPFRRISLAKPGSAPTFSHEKAAADPG